MVIIGYNFFGLEEGCVWDTPICTDMLDEVQLNQGVYDEVYVNLDTTIPDNTVKPDRWSLTTIMDAKFRGNLDAGSIGDGFVVTGIQLYRTVYGSGEWSAVGYFDYSKEFNLYDFVDRYVENGATYQYGVAPVSNEIVGEMMLSDTIEPEYDGIFITDKNENRRLDYDITLGDISHNTSSSINNPINNPYPIVTFGKSNYRSGNLSVLPLSRSTKEMAGKEVDKLAEQINRQEWLDFLNNGKAKVLRMDSGVLMLIVTQNPIVSHKQESALRDLAQISFDYIEIGKLDFENIMKNDLIPSAHRQKMTFDDFGGIVSG